MPDAPKRRRCPQCGEMKVYRCGPRQKFCSHLCAVKGRSADWWKAHNAKITAIRVKNGYSRFIRRMRAVGMTDAQIQAVRKELLNARSRAHTAGYRCGFAAACGERKGRAA